jgi:hypothetical protein
VIRGVIPTLGLNHALVAAAVFLGALALWPWVVSPPLAALTVPAANQTAKPAMPAALPPLASFVAVGDRPLFSPSRRPARAEAVAPVNTALENRYRLIGLVTTENARRAWIAEGARHFEIGEGDMLDGWKIVRVERDRLLLSSPAGQATLTLRRTSNDEKPAK